MKSQNIQIDEREYEEWKKNFPGESFSAWVRRKMHEEIRKTDTLEVRLSKYAIIYANIDDEAQLESNLDVWGKNLAEDFGGEWGRKKLRGVLMSWNPSPRAPHPEA